MDTSHVNWDRIDVGLSVPWMVMSFVQLNVSIQAAFQSNASILAFVFDAALLQCDSCVLDGHAKESNISILCGLCDHVGCQN